MLRKASAILLPAIGYAAAGNLSVLLAVPAGYASIIWPAAGVALAAILLLGYRAWPGVFLGALLTNLWRATHEGTLDPVHLSVLVSSGIAVGATLQAVVGAWLVRRFVGPPGPLDTMRDVVRFLVLGGALACVINACWGPLVVILAGRMPAGVFLDSAWIWWCGDVLGATIVTPLLLTIGAEPRGVWRSRRISLVLPLLGVLALAVALFALASAREREQLQGELQQRAKDIADDLALALQSRLDILQVFASLLEPEDMKETRFLDRMAVRMGRMKPGVESLSLVSWIPYRMPATGAVPDGLEVLPEPVHLFPRTTGQPAMGWEVLRSMPAWRTFLLAVGDGGIPMITAPVDLLMRGGSQRGVLALVPVYAPNAPHDTVQQRRRSLVGFMLGAIPLEELIGSTLARQRLDGLAVHIHDHDEAGQEQVFYRQEVAGPVNLRFRMDTGLHIAGRSWHVALTPTIHALQAERSWHASAIWIAGLLVAGLLGALLLLGTGRTARAEAKAAEHAGALDQARTALEQAGFLRRLADSNVVGTLILDGEGRIHEANDAFLDMIGYSREALVQEEIRWDELSPAEWKEIDRAGFARADDVGGAPAWEREYLRRDGSRVPVMQGVARLEGDTARYVAVVVDLTKVKEAEAELRRQATELETYRVIVNSAPAIIFAKEYSQERSGVYILANPTCQAICGTEDQVGLSDFDLLPEEVAESLRAVDRQVLEAGEPALAEETVPDARTGKLLHAISTKVPLLDAGGKPYAIAGISVDITEQKQLTERLAALVDAIPDVMFRVRADGECLDFKSNHDSSPASMAAEDIIGSSIFELPLPEHVRTLIRQSIDQALGTGTMQEIEYSMEMPHGLRHYEERVVKSGPDEAVMLLRDITDARRTREALQEANAKLRAANEELKEFAYVASHDLQEPLRTVRGFAEMLERRYGDAFDERGRKWLTFIVSGTQRMRDLIEDLLAYSRAGRAETTGPVDTQALVAAILDDSHASIEAAGAEVEVGALPTVAASETELWQVFQNLVSNALKFRRPEVKPRIAIMAEPADGGWRFSVVDNGIGIEPKYYERIFQVFQRLHGRDEYPGTGIGLALVKKIVERQGGAISVRSTPGQGTAFSFTLPAEPPARPDSAGAADPGITPPAM